MAFLSQNTKLAKSTTYGFRSFGIHFIPHKLSGINVCSSASKGCVDSCLNNAGFGAYSKTQEARLKKTKRFLNDMKGSLEIISKEIQAKVNGSKKMGRIPTFRPNLTSDLAWENIKLNGKSLMEMFPDVQFMDYTKSLPRMMRYLTGQFPKNYHLTFSRSENNQNACDIVMGCGGNIAMVFKDRLPKTYRKKRVIDGLKHDLRFLDPKGCIVGLVALGKKAKRDDSGFVIKSHLKK